LVAANALEFTEKIEMINTINMDSLINLLFNIVIHSFL
jgi:hypothetical protein